VWIAGSGVLALIVLMLIMSGRRLQPHQPAAGPEVSDGAPSLSEPPAGTPSTPVPPDQPKPVVEPVAEPHVLAGYEAIYPDQGAMRCSVVGLLPDGAYEIPGTFVAVVSGGVLTASARFPEAERVVYQQLQPRAWVSWQGATKGQLGRCRVEAVQMRSVTGRVVHGDGGEPAADVAIRGCDHGEIVLTDPDGVFSMLVHQGGQCSPMAFVEEDDGSFRRGSYVDVPAGPDDVDGIELTIPPPSAAMDVAAQQQMATGMATLFEASVRVTEDRLATLEDALSSDAISPQMATAFRLEQARLQSRLDRQREQVQMLKSPEDAAATVREAWLNQY